MEIKKEKKCKELVMDLQLKKNFDSTLSFKKLWNTEILLKWT